MMVVKTGLALLVSVLLMFVGNFLSKKSISSSLQGSPFECGVNVLEFSESPMSMRFFMLAVIFLVFDVELILLMPCLLHLLSMMSVSISAVLVSVIVLLMVGIFLEWDQGLLEWV